MSHHLQEKHWDYWEVGVPKSWSWYQRQKLCTLWTGTEMVRDQPIPKMRWIFTSTCQCQYDTSLLSQQVSSTSSSLFRRINTCHGENADAGFTAESDSPQSGMSDPHDPSGVGISSSSNDEYLCIKPTLAKFLVSLGYFSAHRLPLEGKKLS